MSNKQDNGKVAPKNGKSRTGKPPANNGQTKTGSWTIKEGIPRESRELAKKAAELQGIRVGDYINSLIVADASDTIKKELEAKRKQQLPVDQHQLDSNIQQQVDKLNAKFEYMVALQSRTFWQRLTGYKPPLPTSDQPA